MPASTQPHADPAPYRALVHPPGTRRIEVIDQRALPHVNTTIRIGTADVAALAIRKMWVRGAPLIGAVGAYGLALALDADASDAALLQAHGALDATRPTAVNLRWALDRVRAAVVAVPVGERADAAWREADAIAAEDVAINRAIGDHGLRLLRDLAAKRSGPIRVARNGDVCNKIGTYDKALAAADNGVPFYVALPSPTLDATLASGSAIPIETREPDEILSVAGSDDYGHTVKVSISPSGTHAVNYAFDVTPARLVTGLITERGIAPASAAGIGGLFPERMR